MSTTIDSLDIQIRSSAGTAAANIDRLAGSLQRLRDNAKLTVVSNNLKKLSESLTSLQGASTGLSNIKGLAGGSLGHDLGALSDDLVDEGDGGLIPVADRDGTAEIQPVDLEVDELTRRSECRGVTLKHHAIYQRGESFVAHNPINALFLAHGYPP